MKIATQLKHDEDETTVKDGEGITVRMAMMDSVQRAMAERFRDSGPMIHDGAGNVAGHKPGFLYSRDAAVINQQLANQAASVTRELVIGDRLRSAPGSRQAYIDRVSTAWRAA